MEISGIAFLPLCSSMEPQMVSAPVAKPTNEMSKLQRPTLSLGVSGGSQRLIYHSLLVIRMLQYKADLYKEHLHLLRATMYNFHLILLFFFFFPSVVLHGVNYTCPTFREGVNTVVCIINTTAVDNAECDSKQKYVTFDRDTTLCRAPLPSPSNCKKQDNQSPFSCWCDESNQEMLTYKFNYVANRSKDEGAVLVCNYCITSERHGCIISFVSDTKASGAHAIYGRPGWGVTGFLSGIIILLPLLRRTAV